MIKLRRGALVGGVVVVLGVLLYAWLPDRGALVVYCAHDAAFAEPILRQFEKDTGVKVAIRFDTEATKSLGLTELLLREKGRPRCDVFWNNQLLGTAALKAEGVLEPYKGEGFATIPTGFKDAEGFYTGFAARLRVYIVNTDRMTADAAAIEGRLLGDDLSRVAMARPLFGTTLTHYAVLWDAWGGEKLKAWHRDLRGRGLIEQGGNATVKNLVAAGVADFGFTDTDDFFVAKDAGKPVAMLPMKVGDKTICIPNTVAIVKGTRRRAAAERLVDYLLSMKTQLELAASTARQVPLGAVGDDVVVSDEVRQLMGWAKQGYALGDLVDARAACVAWLKSESNK